MVYHVMYESSVMTKLVMLCHAYIWSCVFYHHCDVTNSCVYICVVLYD